LNKLTLLTRGDRNVALFFALESIIIKNKRLKLIFIGAVAVELTGGFASPAIAISLGAV